MTTIGIFYATRQGQTRRIASHVSEKLRDAGYGIEVVDVAHPEGIQLSRFDGVILAASVHVWQHEPEMLRFVRKHRLELARKTTAFISVSLCMAGAEDGSLDVQHRSRHRLNAMWLMDRFFASTHWHPDLAEPVAGALRYTQYPPLKKLLMQQIARLSGGATDLSRDHEYTDYEKLDDLVQRFFALLEERSAPRPIAVA